ncbi:MAG: hypothetical protein M3R55_07050 [Acidobacteriota bacterium]|nr:hypothetical protein [Acidobacteriota bacterium]
MRNLKLAVRLLMRQPLFTLTAVASIAIGIGANTAIFTAVNGLLISPPAGINEHGRHFTSSASRRPASSARRSCRRTCSYR